MSDKGAGTIVPVPTGTPASAQAFALVDLLLSRGIMVCTAESCTAGMAADLIASVPGASGVFWGSFITYTEDAKKKLLGVKEETLKQYGAVSKETALEMAKGALDKSGVDYAISVTGLAGPDGDGSVLPVGSVWIALAGKNKKENSFDKLGFFKFEGTRNEIRQLAAGTALEELYNFIEQD
jgi:PncC family amidohydrolase